MENIIIKVRDLQFSYEDGEKALQGVNLDIKKGQKVVFMGANGSGKSTFFLCLNGIHKPQAGEIQFNETKIQYSKKGLQELRSKVGIVFQDPDHQLFSSSVYQEISFGILNLGVSNDIAKAAIDSVINELEITPFSTKPTHALSGGEKKQVAIADILVMNPEVIILDEPAASLDPKHTEIVHSLIEKLADKGITVIISTHDVEFAYEFADEIILFSDGKVLAHGAPQELFLQKELLFQTNLKQPDIIPLFLSLCEKNILSNDLPLPRNFQELQHYLSQIS
jgi:cobalt/nickel transport system ATP-binding protein